MRQKPDVSKRHINFLNFGIFQGICLFCCAFTYDEVVTHLKEKKFYKGWRLSIVETKELWERNNWGFAVKVWVGEMPYYFLVIKKRFDFKDDSHSRLAHEVLHLTSFLLKDILDPMVENEAFCYTHTHLMNQCYKIIRS